MPSPRKRVRFNSAVEEHSRKHDDPVPIRYGPKPFIKPAHARSRLRKGPSQRRSRSGSLLSSKRKSDPSYSDVVNLRRLLVAHPLFKVMDQMKSELKEIQFKCDEIKHDIKVPGLSLPRQGQLRDKLAQFSTQLAEHFFALQNAGNSIDKTADRLQNLLRVQQQTVRDAVMKVNEDICFHLNCLNANLLERKLSLEEFRRLTRVMPYLHNLVTENPGIQTEVTGVRSMLLLRSMTGLNPNKAKEIIMRLLLNFSAMFPAAEINLPSIDN